MLQSTLLTNELTNEHLSFTGTNVYLVVVNNRVYFIVSQTEYLEVRAGNFFKFFLRIYDCFKHK